MQCRGIYSVRIDSLLSMNNIESMRSIEKTWNKSKDTNNSAFDMTDEAEGIQRYIESRKSYLFK